MTNIYLKDGQEPPKTIRYNLGMFRVFKFNGFSEGSIAELYSRGKFRKSYVMYSEGIDNDFLTMLAKKEGVVFPKDDHWVDVLGYIIMTVVWKPSGKIKYALYVSHEKTLYKYLRKNYPGGKWMTDHPPAWVRGK